MSQTVTKESTSSVEPVEVTNKYDATQLKNAVDDEISRFYAKDQLFVQKHTHTDIKLLLGYVSCFVAAGSFLYEYKTSFYDALTVTTICVVVYWALQIASLAYGYLVEKDEIFAGTHKTNGKTIGSLRINGKMNKFSPKYELTLVYNDEISGKTVKHQVEPNVSTWFNTKGVMVKEAIDKDLSSFLTALKQKLHED